METGKEGKEGGKVRENIQKGRNEDKSKSDDVIDEQRTMTKRSEKRKPKDLPTQKWQRRNHQTGNKHDAHISFVQLGTSSCASPVHHRQSTAVLRALNPRTFPFPYQCCDEGGLGSLVPDALFPLLAETAAPFPSFPHKYLAWGRSSGTADHLAL